MTTPLLFARADQPYAYSLLHSRQDWGLTVADLVPPPARFWADVPSAAPTVELGVDSRRIFPVPHPGQLLTQLDPDDTWTAATKRSLARLHAYFLFSEDPQRRLDARPVETLSHQISLVRHVLDSPALQRVLIADEVGLGKTVEVGLLLQELLSTKPTLRVLYLAPARLVTNVRRELDRLGLHFRQWTAVEGDARLTDGRVVASIHRAVHGANSQRILSAPPWDVLIVDECHHLSAWDPEGGDPREAYKLVRALIEAQPSEGRTIFLSGTPHQGNVNRFENLVSLLRRDGEPPDALSGRVIYRTKDDVRDWAGNPLFPSRQVNEPVVVDLGPQHRAWITSIHDYFKPPPDAPFGQARQRAAGWRCMQALQWAASSPHAGLGYLVRQAARAGWTVEDSSLRDAVAALRPYRLGPEDEPVTSLFTRIAREVARQRDEGDVEDAEDATDDVGFASEQLRRLLVEGTRLVRTAGDEKWNVVYDRILRSAGDEKVVLFAQPVETVTAVSRFLARRTGAQPAMILGGQSDAERAAQVDSFRAPQGPQFLVSSRAGGEGINLQVARRLVHIDVPWNPMDMEQRVGRVHRFGSRQTIIVDTLVVKDSREADAYRIARDKLQRIASAMVEPERFEAIFSRVMCLLPPEALQSVLISEPMAPFSAGDQDQIAGMVQEGFKSWKQFHERFGAQQERIRAQDPGAATWDDVGRFVGQHAGATSAEGYSTLRFRVEGATVEARSLAASVLAFPGGSVHACGDYGGLPVTSSAGAVAPPLGLNVPVVADALRTTVFPKLPSGAAHLRWNVQLERPACLDKLPAVVLVFARQTLRTDPKSAWAEHALALHCYVVRDGAAALVPAAERADLVRGLLGATVRLKPDLSPEFLASAVAVETTVAHELRRPTEDELAGGIRHAVTPLVAAAVSL